MEQVLNDIKKEVNEYLETLFPEKKLLISTILGESMRYALLGGGKRVRATLCVLIGRIFQGKDRRSIPHCSSFRNDPCLLISA